MDTGTFETAVNFHRTGRLAEATQLYRQLLARDPQHADAAYLLGLIAMQTGQNTEAASLFERAVALKPDNPAFQSNLGEALRRLGRFPEAVQAFFSAIALRPDLVEPVFNLGLTLRQAGMLDPAIACFEMATRARPESTQFSHELATARRALEAEPQPTKSDTVLNALSATVLVQLADAQYKQGLSDQAVECLRRARAIAPHDAFIMRRLGSTLLGANRLEEATALHRQIIALSDTTELRSAIVQALAYIPDCDPKTILAEAREWNRVHALPLTVNHLPFDNECAPHRRLRVGFVSPNFKVHVDQYFSSPLFSNADKAEVEIFLYSYAQRIDEGTARIRGYADAWRDISLLSDEQAAEVIRQDRIDILVDMQMHTDGNRLILFAHKPAPIQVCWLAYAGATGLATMDYRFTDPYLDPPGTDLNVYSEQPLCMPDSFWCFDPLTNKPEVGALPALTQGTLTFGCLNNFVKVNKTVLELWARVLNTVQGSKLILYSPEGDVRRNMLATLANAGLDTARVTCTGGVPRQEYLETYHKIDVCLDPFPFNGGATSLESLWMGVPIITLVGNTAMGRAGYSLAMNLGLEEFVARTPNDYVRIALELSRDLPKLGALRATLRSRLQTSPLMDGPRFARNMIALFRGAWARWCEQQMPGS